MSETRCEASPPHLGVKVSLTGLATALAARAISCRARGRLEAAEEVERAGPGLGAGPGLEDGPGLGAVAGLGGWAGLGLGALAGGGERVRSTDMEPREKSGREVEELSLRLSSIATLTSSSSLSSLSSPLPSTSTASCPPSPLLARILWASSLPLSVSLYLVQVEVQVQVQVQVQVLASLHLAGLLQTTMSWCFTRVLVLLQAE